MNNREKMKKYFESFFGKAKCKTEESSVISDSKSKTSSYNINEFKNNFQTIEKYKNEIYNKYFEDFKKSFLKNSKVNSQETEEKDIQGEIDIFTIKKEFTKKFPYISGEKKIDCNSINIPTNQYFMNNLFKGVIQLFENNKSYPANNKYGLVYFREQEWIFFTIEELYYQQYLSDSNKIMSFLYEDYSKDILNKKILFTEDDQYTLPSYMNSKIFEKNAFNYFQLKTQLKQGPDLLLKLIDKREYVQHEEICTFSDYIEQIKSNFDYLEIDGALINDSEKEKSLKDNDIENSILAYKSITFNNIDNIIYLDDKNTNKKSIKIPANSVVFFQTKMKGPNIKLNDNIFQEKLYIKEMREELAVVLYKMIIYNRYFYELYLKLGLIDKKYTALFFLIFDHYPINDISEKVHKYIEIFIKNKLIDYSFTIQPIYMSKFIEEVNSQLNLVKLDNNYKEMRKKYEEIFKKKKKKKKINERIEGWEKKEKGKKEEEKNTINEERKTKEKSLEKKEEELNIRENKLKKNEEEMIKKEKEIEESRRKIENELGQINNKEEIIKKNEEEIKIKEQKMKEEQINNDNAIKNREKEISRRENELRLKENEIFQKEEFWKFKTEEENKIREKADEVRKREDEVRKREDEERKTKEKSLEKKEEELNIRENKLKKFEEEINKNKEKEKENAIHECNEEAEKYAEKIKANAEQIVGNEFKKYKVKGYNCKLIDNIKHYSFKVKIDKNKYIHIYQKGEDINVVFGKKLFDPF